MERFFYSRSVTRISTKIETPILTPQLQVPHQTPLSSIDYINLEFKVQVICNHFLVEENDDIFLVRQHATQIFPFVTYQLPVKIFNGCYDITLEQFLLMKLRKYSNIIENCIKTITDELINRWIMIKDEATNNSSAFDGNVFPFVIILKLWNVATLHERPWFMDIVVDPISNSKIMETLRRVKIEEIERDQTCVICLEEMGKEEEINAIILILQMPCLHVFHEECIKRWLNKRQHCPICRFHMPID